MNSLSEKIEDIENEIENLLKNYDFSQNFDDNINIIIGDKERGKKAKTPLLAVFFDGADIEHAGSSIAEEWQYNIVVVSLVIERKPEIGKRKSNDLVLLGSQILTEDRTLNHTVRDIVRTGFTPGGERTEVGNNTFGAGVELAARFRFSDR